MGDPRHRLTQEAILKMHNFLLNANDDKKAWQIVQDVVFETRATGLTCEEWIKKVLLCAHQRKADLSELYISMNSGVYQDASKKENYDVMKNLVFNNYAIAAKPTSEERIQAKELEIERVLQGQYSVKIDIEKRNSSPSSKP